MNSGSIGLGARLVALSRPLWLAALVAGCNTGMPGETGENGFEVLVAREEFRIGSVLDAEQGFTRIASVTVDHEGLVYVYEQAEHRIRVYGPEGGRLGAIGRHGGGPGEFASDWLRVGVVGDTVWAVDDALRRITLFNRRGELLATTPLPALEVELPPNGLRVRVTPRALRADGLFTSEHSSALGAVGSPDGPGDIPRLLFTTAGEIVDTVGWQRISSTPVPIGLRPSLRLRGTLYLVPAPPPLRDIYHTLDDGYVVIRSELSTPEAAQFSVTRYGNDGGLLFERTYRYAPVAYSAEVLDSLAMRDARVPGGIPYADGRSHVADIDPEAFREIRAALDFPPLQTPTRSVPSLSGSADGSIWLRGEDLAAAHRWYVIRADGSAVVTELPRWAAPAWSDRDVLWAVDWDYVGVPWLVRYRLRTSG